LGSKGQRLRSRITKKHCRCGFQHSCECWLLPVDSLIIDVSTDGSTETVDELVITADVRTRNEPSIDEFISRVEGTKVFGMDDVLSHHAERQRQPGMP